MALSTIGECNYLYHRHHCIIDQLSMGNLFRRHNEPSLDNEGNTNNEHIIHHSLHNQMSQIEDATRVYIKLRQEVTTKEVEDISLNPKYLKLIQSQTWCLNFNDEHINYPYLLSLVSECQGVNTLKIIAGADSLFYFHLQTPKFIHLHKIALSDCSLTTCQFLANIYMPHLQQLCLSNNLLTTVKSLKKIVCRIQILNLRKNPLVSLCDDSIHQISFAGDVQALNFQEHSKEYYGDDLMWYMKLPIKSLRRLEINGKNRIPIQSSKFFKMSQRYKGSDSQMFCWGPRTFGDH